MVYGLVIYSVEVLVRRVNHMEGNLIIKGRERPRKTVDEIIMKRYKF